MPAKSIPFSALADLPDTTIRHRTDFSGQLSTAVYSADERYRYMLSRTWAPQLGHMVCIGLNPSTATEVDNDATITRLMTRANLWGYGGLVMVNLFAYRSTDPQRLKAVADPIGPANATALAVMCTNQRMVLAGWGNDGHLFGRSGQVVDQLTAAGVTLYALAITAQNQPQHPLYVAYKTNPTEWKRGQPPRAIDAETPARSNDATD